MVSAMRRALQEGRRRAPCERRQPRSRDHRLRTRTGKTVVQDAALEIVTALSLPKRGHRLAVPVVFTGEREVGLQVLLDEFGRALWLRGGGGRRAGVDIPVR